MAGNGSGDASTEATRSRHQHIEQQARVVLGDITAHHDVHGQAHGGPVKCRDGEHTP